MLPSESPRGVWCEAEGWTQPLGPALKAFSDAKRILMSAYCQFVRVVNEADRKEQMRQCSKSTCELYCMRGPLLCSTHVGFAVQSALLLGPSRI